MAADDVNRPASGLILGKFLPPTLGHQYLIDFARAFVRELTVIVGTLQREPIPGALRYEWVQEMAPGVRVVHLTDENPQYPEEHPHFWSIWRTSIRKFVPRGPEIVFASEDYGRRLAEILGARYVPVDHGRELVPVSGTAVREDPLGNWRYLPPCVRPYFVLRVCIIGPESTGKSTLARDLARKYETVYVHEYARPLIDAHGGEVTPALFEDIVRGQAAAEAALARQANRLLFCDTDAFTTSLWHEIFYGNCPSFIREEAERRTYHLYLLADFDTPYVADAQRNHPERRAWFFERCRKWLDARKARYAVLHGSWEERFAAACAAVDALLEEARGRRAMGSALDT